MDTDPAKTDGGLWKAAVSPNSDCHKSARSGAILFGYPCLCSLPCPRIARFEEDFRRPRASPTSEWRPGVGHESLGLPLCAVPAPCPGSSRGGASVGL